MEETNKRKWCVYIHTNKFNNKAYIGITSKLPEKRWGNNGNQYDKRQQKAFAGAIKKYGWDNFEHIIWAENLLEEEAKHMEKLLIALYKTNCCKYKNPSYGYNMTDGGDGVSGRPHTDETKRKLSEQAKQRCSEPSRCSFWGKKHTNETKEKMRKNHTDCSGQNNPHYGTGKPVVQLDFNGDYISEYISFVEASKQTGICASAIYSCCKGTTLSIGGFMWKYKDEYNPEEVSRYIHPHFRQVVQLSMCGEYITEHDSMLLAEKATGINKDAIRQCCDGKSRFAGNFVWRDKDKYDPNEKFSYKPKIRALVQLDMDGNFIAEYLQVKFASEITGINPTHISSCCTGKRKSTGGYRWMYKEDYDKLTRQNDLTEEEDEI
jgi:group I intron endonuclease